MTSRAFAIVLIGGAFSLFISTLAANVILDPEQVFGTGLYSHKVNINERVRQPLLPVAVPRDHSRAGSRVAAATHRPVHARRA